MTLKLGDVVWVKCTSRRKPVIVKAIVTCITPINHSLVDIQFLIDHTYLWRETKKSELNSFNKTLMALQKFDYS